VGNPVDVTGAFADKTMLPRLLTVASEFQDVDAIFVVTGAGGTLAAGVATEIVGSAAQLRPEVYVAWVGLTPEVEAIFDGTAASVYPDPMRAAMAANASATFRQGQSKKHEAIAALALLDARPQPRQAREGLWGAAETIDDLVTHGAKAAPAQRVDTLDAEPVLAVARSIGYPVVLKIDSADLNHKSDAGGVRLNLKSDAAVTAAIADFVSLRDKFNMRDAGVLVQAMLTGVEVLVGIKHDDAFGHLLVLGLGGIHAELHADSAVSLLLPAGRDDIAALLARHEKLSTLLAGYRGAPACDVEALVDSIAAVADWATSIATRLKEADFNPIIVNERGAFVVDGRALVADTEEGAE
jgi:acyl-CoA synthetase (NDP forming)